jgi:hypothetical protein
LPAMAMFAAKCHRLTKRLRGQARSYSALREGGRGVLIQMLLILAEGRRSVACPAIWRAAAVNAASINAAPPRSHAPRGNGLHDALHRMFAFDSGQRP